MAQYSEDDFRDMRGMVGARHDAPGPPSRRPPPLLTDPPGDADGRVWIAQGSRFHRESGRYVVLDRFVAHWEGTVDGEFRATEPRAFRTVGSAIAWARQAAAVVIVRTLDESGRRNQEYTAGRRRPPRPLPAWSPRDPEHFDATYPDSGHDFHDTPEGAALSSWSHRPDDEAEVVDVEARGDRATVRIVSAAPVEPSDRPDDVECIKTARGWRWESSKPATPPPHSPR